MASRASCVVAILLAAACARTTLQASVADRHGGTQAMDEMDFWDGLMVQPAVSNRDALHALLLSFGKQPQGAATDWATELKAAKQRGWVAQDADPRPNETARAGAVARIVCMEARIKGGATMRLFGPAERYAVKELNYMGWLPDMTTGQSLSGGQLMAVLTKAEDHLSGKQDTGPKDPKES